VSAHTGFIVAAYVTTAVVLVVLILWVALDGRAQQRRLADLEARGVRRRSAATRVAEKGEA
jgi:heme exporter protein D